MRKTFAVLMALATWAASTSVSAQELCEDVRRLLVSAQSEFDQLKGPALQSPAQELQVFAGQASMHGADACVVAEQMLEARRYSTSYTCSGLGVDSDAAIRELAETLSACLELDAWAEYRQADGRGPWIAQYGLLRLSITRNRERALALAVEVFRDVHGAVMGSPFRGGGPTEDRARCTPKSAEEIAALFSMYGARPGAERFENELFVGYRNSQMEPSVVFRTRPSHPAHPALIVRRVEERDGAVLLHAEGDFAGDCAAFLQLLAEVEAMNRNVGGD